MKIMETFVSIPNEVKLLSGSTSNGEPTFPWKLHLVLEESERLGFSDIISWQGDNTFRVHNQRLFELHVMRSYFKQTQFRSFQRQLNIYGFKRVKVGTDTGSYVHPFFVRGKADMCCFMRRTKIKKKGSRSKRKAKAMEDIPFADVNALDRMITNEDFAPLRCCPNSPVPANDDLKSTAVQDNNLPTSLRDSFLDQPLTSLYVVPCDEGNEIDSRVVGMDNQTSSSVTPTVPLSHGDGNLAVGDSSAKGGMLLAQQDEQHQQLQYPPILQVRNLVQQHQLMMQRLQCHMKSQVLSEKKEENVIPNPQYTGSSNIPIYDAVSCVELDLDTIFDA